MTGNDRYGIDRALLAEARRLGDGFWRLPPGGAAGIVAKVRSAARNAGLSPREYLWRTALDADVSSRPDGSVYWGHVDDTDPSVESHFVAIAWTKRCNERHPGRPATTFWTTPGAAGLFEINLLSPAELGELRLDRYYPKRMWEHMCLRFSAEAAGRVVVFATGFHPRVVLGRTELPALRRNPKVGPDRIEFTYPPPRWLSNGRPVPETVRAVVAEPGNQSMIQFYDPACPGYFCLDGADRLTLAQVRSRVAVLRDEVRSADALVAARPPEPPTPLRPAGEPWRLPVPAITPWPPAGTRSKEEARTSRRSSQVA